MVATNKQNVGDTGSIVTNPPGIGSTKELFYKRYSLRGSLP